jgi:hypothetical protein
MDPDSYLKTRTPNLNRRLAVNHNAFPAKLAYGKGGSTGKGSD